MQTIVLARALARHRAACAPRISATDAPVEAAVPAARHPVAAAIARHSRVLPRTLMEMARGRDKADGERI